MQTILVPVDFSPTSRNAAVYAAELARVFNTRLILFHAYMLPTPVSEVPFAMATVEDLQHDNEKLIKNEAEHLHNTYGTEIEWIVRIGIAADEIRNLVKEKEADLVVIGMKGAGGLDKIIGSTTTSVIRKLRTPVLVVPHETGYSTIRHITYASDFSYKTNLQLFNPLLEIARTFQAKIHILHVQKEEPGSDELSGKRHDENIFEGYEHDYYTITDDSVTHGINQYLKQHASDLLVMVAHKHTFFERIFSKTKTTAMAYESTIPLLILQDKE